MEITVTEFFAKFGSTIGAFIGAFVPVSAILWRFYRERRERKKATRKAIKADLGITQGALNKVLEKHDKVSDPKEATDFNLKELTPTMSQAIFRNLINQIGELTSEETLHLVQYYKLLDTFTQSKRPVSDRVETVKTLLEWNEEIIKLLDKNI